uniref:Phosphoesterase n=1 Tax=uncultured bacterium pFosLip TaxID=380391 RepID=Q1PAF5_9BACT|nr:phosphoesterase [uncultured bacterium pFosLip]
MILFIVTFLSIYGLIHLYAFVKARSALRFGAARGAVLGLFMAFMVFSPIIVRTSERLGLETFAVYFSYAGYIWMGLLFLFISWSLLFDICRFIVWLFGRVCRYNLTAMMPPAKSSFYLTLILTLIAAAYGSYEAADIRTERVVIKTDKMPKENGRLRIVQISDVHIGLIVREWRLQRIVDKVRNAGPDILVSTGDLVDGQIDGLDGLSGLLKGIDAPYGKFAIPGNHEYYAGFGQSAEFIKNSGFRLLEGEAVTIPGLINIAGVDDPAARRFGLYTAIPEEDLLLSLDGELFTLLLKHLPLINEDSLGRFDLQLSGHTHRGQIFPFKFIVRFFFPRLSGYFELEKDSRLYVSRGTGTWGPPIRFLSPPEVTVIDLVGEKFQ